METLTQILWLCFGGFLCWLTYRYVKANPEMMSKQNLSKSFGTMGVLTLLLIVFIAFLVMLTR